MSSDSIIIQMFLTYSTFHRIQTFRLVRKRIEVNFKEDRPLVRTWRIRRPQVVKLNESFQRWTGWSRDLNMINDANHSRFIFTPESTGRSFFSPVSDRSNVQTGALIRRHSLARQIRSSSPRPRSAISIYVQLITVDWRGAILKSRKSPWSRTSSKILIG